MSRQFVRCPISGYPEGDVSGPRRHPRRLGPGVLVRARLAGGHIPHAGLVPQVTLLGLDAALAIRVVAAEGLEVVDGAERLRVPHPL